MSPPRGHDGVADELVEGTLALKDAADHPGEVDVELPDDFRRGEALAEFGVTADVGEEDSDGAFRTAELHVLRMFQKMVQEIGRKHAGEDLLELLAAFLFLAPAKDDAAKVDERVADDRPAEGDLEAPIAEDNEGDEGCRRPW